MTDGKLDSIPSRLETLLAQDRDLVKVLLKEALDQILQAEMTEFLGAAPGEPSVMRMGSRAGYYKRGLITRAGKIELRVPRDRSGEFSTALFERFPQSEKALVSALVEMYMQGVSTHTVRAITEELCNHIFAALTICAISEGLDEAMTKFARRRLSEEYLDRLMALYCEKVTDNGTNQEVEFLDRKSTRLNSSHVAISYAVFCLK